MTRVTHTRTTVSVGVATTLLLAAGLAGGALADEAPLMLAAAAPTVAPADVGRPLVTSVDRDEQRISQLHDRLGITASQEDLWGEVAHVMRLNDDRIDVLATERHGRASTMTAVEDLRSYGEITEAHAAGIRAFVPAFENLYNSMSTTQKANADIVFRHTDDKTHKKAM
jgi:hypothetical protein